MNNGLCDFNTKTVDDFNKNYDTILTVISLILI